jgi:DNA-3-methyladenine glycosylase
MKLDRDFYLRADVVQISKELLGKYLCTRIHGTLTTGIITETEAYAGTTDRASHAYGGRRTKRTETMFSEGGRAYVYLCYGIHHLFNVVTNVEGIPHAVLIRGVKPANGLATMLKRRNKDSPVKNLSSGPATVSEALGIKTNLDGSDLLGKSIWIEDRGVNILSSDISSGPRVGVDYAGKDALLPWRFRIL